MKKNIERDTPFFNIAKVYVVTWLLLMSLSFAVCCLLAKGFYSDFFRQLISRWDSNSFARIAEEGYTATGDSRFMLVFFPLFPWIVRLVHLITRMPYLAAATTISYISTYFAAVMLYKILRINFNPRTSMRGVKYFLIFPFSFFFFTGMSEAFYLMLLFCAIYFIRKRKYLLGGAFGFLLSLTRLPGVIIGVLFFVETVFYIKTVLDNDGHYKEAVKACLKPVIGMFMTLSGFLSYLLLNYIVTGDAFRFMMLQKENWGQYMTNPLYMLKIVFDQQIARNDSLLFWGVAIPNLLSFALCVVCFFYLLRFMPASYSLYHGVYTYICYSPSWLLSGGRYSLGAFGIYIMLAGITKKKWVDAILTIASFAFLVFWTVLYIYYSALY